MINYDAIENCVENAYRLLGEKFLGDSLIAKNALRDLMSDLPRERKLLELAIDEGVLSLFYDVDGRSEEALAIRVARAQKVLQDTGFLDQTSISKLIACVSNGICGNLGAPYECSSKASDSVNIPSNSSMFVLSDEEISAIKKDFRKRHPGMRARETKIVATPLGSTMGLYGDGTLFSTGTGIYELPKGMQAKRIASGTSTLLAILKTDGGVYIRDPLIELEQECKWKQVIDLAVGKEHVIALDKYSMVQSFGSNEYGQRNVQEWERISTIAAGTYMSAGLCADGTVVVAGPKDAFDVSSWREIVSLGCCDACVVGVRADGSVVSAGALRGAGYCGGVDQWRNVTSVACACLHTIGLKTDGTVLATGDNEYGQCNVSHWRDIIAIWTGPTHTVGLKADGSLIATGDNEFGQCDVSEFHNIQL